MRATVIVASWFILVSHSQAQPGPQGPPPAFKVVASTKPDKGELVFLETVTRMVPVQKQVVVIKNGQQVTETVTEYVSFLEQRHVLIDIGKSRVITPDGKQLPIDEVWKRLKAGTVIVLAADANTPAQIYLRALNAETLVIIPGPMKK